MQRYRTSLCCRSGMSYRMARTLSRIAKLGEKAVARSNCSQNRNILFKCPRWSSSYDYNDDTGRRPVLVVV